jgi:hypothetical protein
MTGLDFQFPSPQCQRVCALHSTEDEQPAVNSRSLSPSLPEVHQVFMLPRECELDLLPIFGVSIHRLEPEALRLLPPQRGLMQL